MMEKELEWEFVCSVCGKIIDRSVLKEHLLEEHEPTDFFQPKPRVKW